MNSNKLIHDIRNPLNTISINAELGKLVLERTGDIQKAISVFDIILAECRRCGELVNELHVKGSGTADEDNIQ